MRWVEVHDGFVEELTQYGNHTAAQDERELRRDDLRARVRAKLAKMSARQFDAMNAKVFEDGMRGYDDELTRYDTRPTDEEHERLRRHIQSL